MSSNLLNNSNLRYGGSLTFSVRLPNDGGVLPGKSCPDAYLDELNLCDLDGMTVVIVCPGNGGLVYAALNRGAKKVIAIEPRYLYDKSLPTIVKESDPGSDRLTIITAEVTPKLIESVGTTDIVIWPNDFQGMNRPKLALKLLVTFLSLTGVCYLEVAHGQAGLPEGNVSNWKPTEDAFAESLQSVSHTMGAQLKAEIVSAGRLENRIIYRIQEDCVMVLPISPIVESQPEPVKKPKPKAKRKARSKKKVDGRGQITQKMISDAVDKTGLSQAQVEERFALWGKNWLVEAVKGKQSKGTTSSDISMDIKK